MTQRTADLFQTHCTHVVARQSTAVRGAPANNNAQCHPGPGTTPCPGCSRNRTKACSRPCCPCPPTWLPPALESQTHSDSVHRKGRKTSGTKTGLICRPREGRRRPTFTRGRKRIATLVKQGRTSGSSSLNGGLAPCGNYFANKRTELAALLC